MYLLMATMAQHNQVCRFVPQFGETSPRQNVVSLQFSETLKLLTAVCALVTLAIEDTLFILFPMRWISLMLLLITEC